VITVKLRGGLGNQLFGYFAGRFLADKLATNLDLDLSEIFTNKTPRKPDILYLNLPSYTYSVNEIPRHTFAKRLNKKLSAKCQLISDLHYKTTKEYISHDLGFIADLVRIEDNSTLDGYFQTWKYFDSYSAVLPEISLINEPSARFQALLSRIEDSRPVVMHVRKTDYTLHKDSFGLLSPAYYIQALKKLPFDSIEDNLWVFSDDIEEAKRQLKSKLPQKTLWIHQNNTENAAETLVLMSRASAFIIANSTFSWWAASLSKSGQKVIAPWPWFRNLPAPREILHPEWERFNSQWE
jgi:hypothetical protein